MNPLKIVVSAYACEPGLGSEIGVGWHWIWEMSRYFEVWVLTRESNRATIERWLEENSLYSDVHFLYYDLPKWARFWKKGLRGVHLYYYLWQRLSNSIVKQTMLENEIEIFHHLTYGNALWKVSSYGQKQCFIWGPVGGLETIPTEYSRHYGFKSRFMEWVRRIAVATINRNRSFMHRCSNASLILCKTNVTLKKIPIEQRRKAVLFSDVAGKETKKSPSINREREYVSYLMVGRLDAWRGFDLAIESFARARNEYPNIHLNIIGKGRDEKRLRTLIAKKKLGKMVSLCGKVSQSEYEKMLDDTDVFINTSLKEGGVTVSYDSVSKGKPQIDLDTTGYTRLLQNCGAIVIPQGGREEVIQCITKSLLLLTNPEERMKLSREAFEKKITLTWEKHGKAIRDVICQAYKRYCINKQHHQDNTDCLLQRIVKANDGALYFSLVNADGKRLLLPAKNIKTAMAIYQPGSKKGKLLKATFPYLSHLPFVGEWGHIKKMRLSIDKTIVDLTLKIFGCTSPEFSIFGGTPSINQKITIQVSEGKKIVGYLKLTDKPQVAELFAHEQNVLNQLHSKGINHISQCLYCNRLPNNVYVFAQSTERSEKAIVCHCLTDYHKEFLYELYTSTKKTLRWEDSSFALSLEKLNTYINDFLPNDQAIIKKAITIIGDYYGANNNVEFCMYHGDFTPWNTFITEEKIFTFDFEYAASSCPPYMDACHFLSETARLELKLTPQKAYTYIGESIKQIECITNFDYLLLGYLLYTLSFYSQLYCGQFSTQDKGYVFWMELIELIAKNNNFNKKNERSLFL